jgi:hypothetical protein
MVGSLASRTANGTTKFCFFHEQMAEFTPVSSRDEVYRLFNEARAALGLWGEDPSSN